MKNYHNEWKFQEKQWIFAMMQGNVKNIHRLHRHWGEQQLVNHTGWLHCNKPNKIMFHFWLIDANIHDCIKEINSFPVSDFFLYKQWAIFNLLIYSLCRLNKVLRELTIQLKGVNEWRNLPKSESTKLLIGDTYRSTLKFI